MNETLETIDQTLKAQRLEWLKASNPSDRKRWMKNIDQSLDTRLELMRVRDQQYP